MRLAVVTATTNPLRAQACVESWGKVPIIAVINGLPTAEAVLQGLAVSVEWIVSPEYLGTVPAFRLGVDYALEQTDADVIACLHDDVEIFEPNWVEKVIRYFDREPSMGLAGFGGAVGLGDAGIYLKPYDPMQLARIGFRSNLVDAEVHGGRSLLPEQVACLDGFSQIGRRAFWSGDLADGHDDGRSAVFDSSGRARPWTVLEDLGLIHHIYDGALGCLAARYGWDTWYLPVRCRHHGGQTAVGDSGYATWAKTQRPNGDQGFWEDGHRLVYDAFQDVLPLRV